MIVAVPIALSCQLALGIFASSHPFPQPAAIAAENRTVFEDEKTNTIFRYRLHHRNLQNLRLHESEIVYR